MPQNSVKDILKDKYGFIWMSTEEGLLRYDGSNFIHYKNFNIKNINFSDFNGNIDSDHIVVYNDMEKNAVTISKRTPIVTNDYRLKNEWTSNNKKYQRLIKNNTTVRFFSYVDRYYIEVSSGRYYFEKNLIIYKNNKDNEEIKIPFNFSRQKLTRIFVHGDYVFIGDHEKRQTISLYNGNLDYIKVSKLYDDPNSSVYWQQTSNQTFIVNHGKIYKSEFLHGKLTLRYLLQYNAITKELAGAMFYDEAFDKLYIGSQINGLKIFSLSNFKTSTKNMPYQDEVSYASIPFSDSSVVTQDGFQHFSNNSRKVFPSLRSYDKRFLFTDNSGNLIYRENWSIHRRYKKEGYRKYDSILIKKKKIEGLFKEKNLFFASVSDGISRSLYIFEHDCFNKIARDIPISENINSILQITNDLLYLGSSGGLYQYSLSQNKILGQIGSNIPVKHIIQTRDKKVWITTFNQGIYLVKAGKPFRLQPDKNNYIANSHYILEDKNSNFWISTNNGLFKIKKNNLLGRGDSIYYYRYTKESGLLTNEFNGGSNPCGNVLANGMFVFPSMNGFVFFDPDTVKSYYPKQKDIYVERVQMEGRVTKFTGQLFLKAGYKIADVHIDIPYFSDIENIYLEGKLEKDGGGNWVNIGKNRKFSITTSDPGKYNLIIRFLSENGTFSYKTIPVVIEAHFYQTFMFRIIVLGTLLIIIFLIVQLRTNFLQIKNKSLSKTISNKNKEIQDINTVLELTQVKLKSEFDYQKKLLQSISHDITTPVKFIANLSHELNNSGDDKMQKKYFNSIHKASEQLYKFTLGLKEYSELYKQPNYEEENLLFGLLETKKLLFEEIANTKNTYIYNQGDAHTQTRINKNILLVIFHNIFDNAVKNTNNGIIIISTVTRESETEIIISDTGNGMSTEQMDYYSNFKNVSDTENKNLRNYGLGLHMVLQLIIKINAKILFQKNYPRGTIVKIIINN